MNDDYEDSISMADNMPIGPSNQLPQVNTTEDSIASNDTINSVHTLNKRLDPSIDPDNGQMYEDGHELQNLGSIDYYSDNTANRSLLDHHMHIINLLKQQSREGKNNGHLPRVKIHNIISGLPKPEIEMLYAVYQGIHRLRHNLICQPIFLTIKVCFVVSSFD